MLKIMIIDDMDIVRRELKRMKLWGEQSGFIISDEAGDGHEALEKLRCNAVDLIITDIRMPKIDGIELLKRVAEEKLSPCFIIMSDYSEFSYARQGLVLGAFDYIVKPVDEAELKKLLERARNFIIEARNEQQRVKQLEQSFIDKKESYYSQVELNQLLEFIKTNDARLSHYSARLVDTVSCGLSHDIIRTTEIINKMLYEILTKMQENYKWLDKFIVTDNPEMSYLRGHGDLDSIKAKFLKELEELIILLNKLRYDGNESQLVNQVCKCVLDNVDQDISLKTVSDLIFMNKTYVSEAFKQKTGIAFTEYMTMVKMERAKRLIADARLKNYEIAELLGYRDIEYFSKLFKKYTGSSPTEYKQKILRACY